MQIFREFFLSEVTRKKPINYFFWRSTRDSFDKKNNTVKVDDLHTEGRMCWTQISKNNFAE